MHIFLCSSHLSWYRYPYTYFGSVDNSEHVYNEHHYLCSLNLFFLFHLCNSGNGWIDLMSIKVIINTLNSGITTESLIFKIKAALSTAARTFVTIWLILIMSYWYPHTLHICLILKQFDSPASERLHWMNVDTIQMSESTLRERERGTSIWMLMR